MPISKGNTGIISVRLSCTTMKNSRTYIFVCSDTEVNAKALHYGHKAKKNFIAASKAFQDDYHAQVAIHCGMARLGPKKQRLTRAEWKAQKEHAMKVAAAEVRCSIPLRPRRRRRISDSKPCRSMRNC